jgi:choline dehydrogenase-like flavoprotein
VSYSDVIVIGSGFGGSISATNLALAAKQKNLKISITMLERGHDYHNFDPDTVWKYRNEQGNGFKQTYDPSYSAGLLEGAISSPENGIGYPNFIAMAGKGVGGSSLVYYAVKLRAATEIFEMTRDGRRLWPEMMTRSSLNPYYAKVENNMKVTRLAWSEASGAAPWQLCTKRDHVFAQGCLGIGATAEPLKVATHNDANDGWWVTGHRFGGKQHLPLNYLRFAQDNGVKIQADCDVKWVSPGDKGGYVVCYYDHRFKQEKVVECKLLILSGGVIGTLQVLLNSSGNFNHHRELSPVMGHHISGNGDFSITGIVGRQYSVDSYKGKPMSSVCPSFWDEHKFLMIPFDAPSLPLAFGQPAEFSFPRDKNAVGRKSTEPSDKYLWGDSYLSLLREWGRRIMTVGVLTLDHSEGRVSRRWSDIGKRLFIDWPETHPETEKRWMTALDKIKGIFHALDGEIFMDMYRYRGTVGTVHQLGGCRFGEDKDTGVVSQWGEVFDNPNMFVFDSSIIPSALGVNPSLTIAAVTEMLSTKLASELEDRLN